MSTLATLPVPVVPVHTVDQNPTVLTHEVFLDTMQAMLEHYKKEDTRNAYAIPLDLIPMTAAEGHLQAHATPVPNGKAQVAHILADGKAGLSTFVKNQQAFVQKQASMLHAKPKPTAKDTADFAAQMDAQHAIAKKEVDDQIDKTFATLKATGQSNPALMSGILNTASSFASTALHVLQTVTLFFKSIVPKVLGWLKSAGEFLGKVASETGAVVGAVQGVLSFL